jgi:TatD DNase family protein
MFTDSHCHLDKLDLQPYGGELSALIEAAGAAGVGRMLCIGVDANNVDAVCSIAADFDKVYASVGLHPLACKNQAMACDELVAYAGREKVIAIGETGLDYHYDEATAAAQQASFVVHLSVASELGLPVVVHTREARRDTMALINEHADKEIGGVLHCFTEDWQMAKQALDANFYISFSGIVTFQSARELREVAARVPADRLLIETDSPWLAPVPHRGKTNEPRLLPLVAAKIAELRGVSVEVLAEQTSQNFDRLFQLAD